MRAPPREKKMINNPDMIDELVHCCQERMSYGQNDIKELSDRLASLNDATRKSVCYHSECRKPIVNKSMIERLKNKRSLSDPQTCVARGPGLPVLPTLSGPKEQKPSQRQRCVCSRPVASVLMRLHQNLSTVFFSDRMGENFLEIKAKTQDDCVRTCVSELEGAGDASALEKYYHRKCLRSAQRTCTPTQHGNDQLI